MIENAQTQCRNEMTDKESRRQEFRKRLAQATRYQKELELVGKIYEKYAQKDITTLSPEEREVYRVQMDRIRYARVALESDRPVEEQLAELDFQLGRQ
jgi:hypothetical protein